MVGDNLNCAACGDVCAAEETCFQGSCGPAIELLDFVLTISNMTVDEFDAAAQQLYKATILGLSPGVLNVSSATESTPWVLAILAILGSFFEG